MNALKKKILIVIGVLLLILGIGVACWYLGIVNVEEFLAIDRNSNTQILDESVQIVSEVDDENVFEKIEVTQNAKELYSYKNPYIGNASANGVLIQKLTDLYAVKISYMTELQTSQAPYWITLRLEEKPDIKKMWKIAILFVALTDNCEEFRWSYPDKEGVDTCFYMTREFINEFLQVSDVKVYGETEEGVQELLNLLEEENEMLAEAGRLSPQTKWDAHAQRLEIDDDSRKSWDVRFISDGICFRGDTVLTDAVYGDFDKNGQEDLCFLVSGSGVEEWSFMIYVYMNDDEVYSYPMKEVTGWSLECASGDFDADKCTELAMLINTGGNGGSGSYAKVLLKYTGDSFQEMQLPGDFVGEEKQGGDMGYHLDVSYAKGEGNYKVTFPAISESVDVQSEYFKTASGEYFYDRHPVGESVGGNCRGYFAFEVIEQDGRDYLAAKEYTYKEGGINDGLGEATFLLDWDDKGKGYVKNWWFEVY